MIQFPWPGGGEGPKLCSASQFVGQWCPQFCHTVNLPPQQCFEFQWGTILQCRQKQWQNLQMPQIFQLETTWSKEENQDKDGSKFQLTCSHLKLSLLINPAAIQVTPANSWQPPSTFFRPSLSRRRIQAKCAGIYGNVWFIVQFSTIWYLNKNGQTIVEVEVRCESCSRWCEAVVAHGRHHPVEEHGAGSVQD